MITIKIRCATAIILQVILDSTNLMSGNAVLAFTYAKVYSRGGGWWAVSGYASDGSDTHKVIKLINELKG